MHLRTFLTVLFLACSAAAAQAAELSDRELAAALAAETKKLDEDLLNESAARRLSQLRKEEAARRQEALKALIAGLQAYAEGRWAVAGHGLEEALASRSTTALAEAILPQKLSSMASRARQAGGSAQPRDNCRSCGGSTIIECSSCNGAGVEECRRCDGKGAKKTKMKKDPTTTYNKPCEACNRRGFVPCDRCGGKGFVPCSRCGEKRSAGQAPKVTRREREAIGKVIAKAEYVLQGGIDFETEAVLAPTPEAARREQ